MYKRVAQGGSLVVVFLWLWFAIVEGLAAGSSSRVLYEDKYLRLDEEKLTLFWYYFPTGTSRTIPLSQVKSVTKAEDLDLSWFAYKTWGQGVCNIWWSWGNRWSASNVVVEVHEDWLRKGTSVEDADQLLFLLSKLRNQHK
ncbi:hypothetical protein QOT17_021055 [Balamuthia mandrillaris]